MHHIFGPVPSRRLGRSLGINNIPPKVCTYACRYCQVGKTSRQQYERQFFYDPQKLVDETKKQIGRLETPQAEIDYLTIVSDGEPTLDINLALLIRGLKKLDFPVAVISNASLLWDKSVCQDLQETDFVSVKVDAVSTSIWRKINRPVPGLSLASIKTAVKRFAADYPGHLVSETMLLQNINDNDDEFRGLAGFLADVNPHTAYLAVPTRPPAVPTVRPASADALTRAFAIFSAAGIRTEFLIGYEGNAFASTGSAKDDLLSITAVHPLRQDAVHVLLQKSGATWQVVNDLLAAHQLKKIKYNDKIYYTRQLEYEHS